MKIRPGVPAQRTPPLPAAGVGLSAAARILASDTPRDDFKIRAWSPGYSLQEGPEHDYWIQGPGWQRPIDVKRPTGLQVEAETVTVWSEQGALKLDTSGQLVEVTPFKELRNQVSDAEGHRFGIDQDDRCRILSNQGEEVAAPDLGAPVSGLEPAVQGGVVARTDGIAYHLASDGTVLSRQALEPGTGRAWPLPGGDWLVERKHNSPTGTLQHGMLMPQVPLGEPETANFLRIAPNGKVLSESPRLRSGRELAVLEDGTVMLTGHYEDGHSPVYRLSEGKFELVTQLPGWAGRLDPAPGGNVSALHNGPVSRITPTGQVDTVVPQGEREHYRFREMLDAQRALFLDAEGSNLWSYDFESEDWTCMAEGIQDLTGLKTGRGPGSPEAVPPGILRQGDRVRVGRVWLPRRT